MDADDLPRSLTSARESLWTFDDEDLVGLLRSWAARWWEDPVREAGQEGLNRLCVTTGWLRPHLIEALRRAFQPWISARFRIASRARAESPARRDLWLFAILAGRIPALAVSVVFRSLAARVPLVLKPSTAEPVFCHLLRESARRHSERIGEAIRVITDPEVVASLVREAPACLAYGRDETVAAIRETRQGRPTWCGGHREALVAVYREALESSSRAVQVAGAIARDCAIYDQSGCLSPQVVFCEEDGRVRPTVFAEMLWSSLASLERRWPSAMPPLEESATVRSFAEEARFLAFRTGGQVLPERGLFRPLVCLMPRGVYRPGPGHRVLQVLTFTGAPEFWRQTPSLARRLQGIAVAGDRSRLERVLDANPEYRAPYICRPGRLQRPPANWRENGLDLTAELVRLSRTDEGEDAG